MDINLHRAQSEIFTHPARFKVIRCGRRFGKTYCSVTKLIYEALKVKGDYWFISPYYRQSKEIAWQLLGTILPAGTVQDKNESQLSVVLRNGSTIKLKGADNPESLKGVGLAGCILDEYAFMRPYVWSEIIRPMLFDTGGWAWFISTPQGYNHFWNLWEWVASEENPTPEAWKRFHYTTFDNPHIKPEEILQSRSEMSEERYSQEIMAEFTKKSGAIWPAFSREVHVKPRRNPDRNAAIFASIDFGYAIGHPTAFLLHEVVGENVFTFDGFLREGLTPQKVAEQAVSLSQGMVIRALYADSARPDLIESLRLLNFPTVKANKDVEIGIAKVGQFMAINPLTNLPRWTISDHLGDAIRQIEEYEWQDVRGEDGNFRQAPKKEADDAPDALRYFMATYTTFDESYEDYDYPTHKPIFKKTGW